MCFSASASFAVAVGAAVAGAITFTRARTWKEIPLASMPLVFSLQQATEGVLWSVLAAGEDAVVTRPLATSFAAFALVIWPVFAPFAAALVEHRQMRRLTMGLLLVLGLAVALYGARDIIADPYDASIVRHSLAYNNRMTYPPLVVAAYVTVVSGCRLD
jgi:hypothetical protein